MEHLQKFIISIGCFTMVMAALIGIWCVVMESSKHLRQAVALFIVASVLLSAAQLIF